MLAALQAFAVVVQGILITAARRGHWLPNISKPAGSFLCSFPFDRVTGVGYNKPALRVGRMCRERTRKVRFVQVFWGGLP
jgi:hypothetical protein